MGTTANMLTSSTYRVKTNTTIKRVRLVKKLFTCYEEYVWKAVKFAPYGHERSVRFIEDISVAYERLRRNEEKAHDASPKYRFP